MPSWFVRSGLVVVAAACASSASAGADEVPAGLRRALPTGYSVIHAAIVRPDASHTFYVLALALRAREAARNARRAPARPLMIYQRRADGGYVLVARNDEVVRRADDGGQCDPFEFGGITAKGAYFTVENDVACGAHWTDYVTFRFDARAGGFVFDNRRTQSWSLNPSNDPNAEALISDGQSVTRPPKGSVVPFARWRMPD